MKKPERDPLLPKHGGYRKLKSFQVAQLAYDVTVRFCDRYIDRRSRTHDQMVQASDQTAAQEGSMSVVQVVRQLTVTGLSGKAIRPDLTLFLNGLPIAVIELKDPTNTEADLGAVPRWKGKRRWRIGDREEDRANALLLYNAAFEKRPKHAYRKRIEELQ